LGGEGLPSKCVGAGAEERSKGAAREIAANQQDRRTDLEVCRAWLFVALYFPQMGHYPRTGAQDFINKINSGVGFPFGVFPGVFTQKSCVQCVWFQFLCFRCNFVSN
jgi:hypothetical protein